MVQTNTFRCFPVSQTCSHLGTVSSSHGLWRMESGSLAWPHPFPQEREGVWPRVWPRETRSQGGVDYNIVSPLHSTITGVVVRGLRSSSVAVAHEGYLVQSRRPLWFGSSQANRSVFNTLSTHRWRQCHAAC